MVEWTIPNSKVYCITSSLLILCLEEKKNATGYPFKVLIYYNNRLY